MKLHTIKTTRESYTVMDSGEKPFGLLKDDRDYNVDDLVVFNIIDENGVLEETDEIYQITYILRNVPQYGLKEGFCILGIRKTGGRLSTRHSKEKNRL